MAHALHLRKIIILVFCFLPFAAKGLIISEFMASNSASLEDEDGDFSDWIEIYNPSASAVNLFNYSLTDEEDEPDKWVFPDIQLPSGSYLIIFASGKNRKPQDGELHTGFKLSASGEYLALCKPDNNNEYLAGDPYPEQYSNISFGDFGGSLIYFNTPTPGTENVADEYLTPPVFDRESGFYYAPFNITITTFSEDAVIYYTTDGTTPDAATGSVYNSPLNIATTTPLRAIAMKNGNTSGVLSATYIFPNDVLTQPVSPAGYPAQWGEYVEMPGSFAIADYEMDPDIVNHDEYEDLMVPSLLSIPSLSVITDIKYLFSNVYDETEGGIYIYTGAPGDERGLGWERPASVELLSPDGSEEGFQINCGISIQGGHSRRPEKSPKHSFRLLFKSAYGPGRLEYPVFGDESPADFNTLVLRASYGNTWRHMSSDQRQRAQHIRDLWAKDTQHDMGHLSAQSRYIHLYLNGLYWGVYNFTERLDKEYMESYSGGDKDDYDIIKDYNELVDGNFEAWNYLWNKVTQTSITDNEEYQKLLGRNPDGSTNPAYRSYVDAINLIDYILINFYGGNNDWDDHNWVAARNRVSPGNGFQFYCWDTEKILENKNENYVNENNSQRPSGIFQELMSSEEFRLLFADRVNRHLRNGGLLTPEPVTERWMKRADQVQLPLVSESARWGDYRRDVHPWVAGPFTLYTVNDHWLTEQDRLVNDYFRDRTDIVLSQLENLLPSIDAPVFSQHGGRITGDFLLGITANSGTIYYTTDGTDPRLPGGTIRSSSEPYSQKFFPGINNTVKARARLNNTWSALTEAYFYDMFPQEISVFTDNSKDLYAYPNPFSESTKLQCYLPEGGQTYVKIFSADGKLIASFDEGYRPQGLNTFTYKPEGIDQGMYFFRIECGYYSVTGKIFFLP